MVSVWMRSRSLFSCALKCATQKTQTLAWQHILQRFNHFVPLSFWQCPFSYVGSPRLCLSAVIVCLLVRWRRRRRFTRFHPFHPYHPYGPTSTTASGDTTSTTSGMVFPVCTLISATRSSPLKTVLSGNASETVRVRFRGFQFDGCCIEDVANSLSLQVNFNSSRADDLNVSLAPPNLQSQPLGVVPGTDFQFNFSGNIFKGVEAGGGWEVIFLASPAAIGWSSELVAQLELKLDQCV